jgi:hypothetical protein
MAFEHQNVGRARVALAVDEGAQLGSAYPEITRWPEPLMQAGTGRHISPGE